MDFPAYRTPEQGHTAACLAKAMIAAIENMRDAVVDDATRLSQPWLADWGFRGLAHNNIALKWADEYLDSGTTECICPPGASK